MSYSCSDCENEKKRIGEKPCVDCISVYGKIAKELQMRVYCVRAYRKVYSDTREEKHREMVCDKLMEFFRINPHSTTMNVLIKRTKECGAGSKNA